MLWRWAGIGRQEAHHAEPPKDYRESTNYRAWKRRRITMGHALNRAGVLVRGIREHHTGHLARVSMVIQADDVPAE